MGLLETGQNAAIAYGVSVVLFFVVLAIALNFLGRVTSTALAYGVSWIGLLAVFGIFSLLRK
jgi:hypothetical protein